MADLPVSSHYPTLARELRMSFPKNGKTGAQAQTADDCLAMLDERIQYTDKDGEYIDKKIKGNQVK